MSVPGARHVLVQAVHAHLERDCRRALCTMVFHALAISFRPRSEATSWPV